VRSDREPCSEGAHCSEGALRSVGALRSAGAPRSVGALRSDAALRSAVVLCSEQVRGFGESASVDVDGGDGWEEAGSCLRRSLPRRGSRRRNCCSHRGGRGRGRGRGDAPVVEPPVDNFRKLFCATSK